MMLRAVVIAAAVVGCSASLAATKKISTEPVVKVNVAAPNVSSEDRIQAVDYNAFTVYNIYSERGRAILVRLQDGETVDLEETEKANTGLGMGFGSAWWLTVRGNNFFLKQKDENPETNLIIVTNKRPYIFDLKKAPVGMNPTYALYFRYPEDERAKADAEAERRRAATAQARVAIAQATAVAAQKDELIAPAKAKPVRINTEYIWRGKNSDLAPTAIWDDGRFTYLQYNHAGALPVFFRVLPDGSEALVNSNIDTEDKTTTVIQDVVPIIRARLNDSVIEIVNKNYRRPEFNEFGTSVHGAVRVEKPAPAAKQEGAR